MFKAIPERPPDMGAATESSRLRQHAMELVMAEVRHQPVLKARNFIAGLLSGIALMAVLGHGYHRGLDHAEQVILEAMAQLDTLAKPDAQTTAAN